MLLAAAVFAAVVISQSWAGNPITGASILSATVSALSLGAIYALAASGLVVTYTTTGIFNFAQGAIGMVMAYIFWQCTQSWGWPQLPSVLLVVLVIAPAFGVLLYVVLMRHLVGADLVVQIMATIGLMVGLMGLAAFVWDPQDFRQIPYFFEGEGFHVGDTFVLWHRAIAVIVGVVVAVGLRAFLRRTQTGLAMRAVVDDPDLAALHAAPPARVSALAWAISASLGATAGLLLAPEVQLSIEGLTLLIVDAFAAAILGRLRSLPLTVAGGILLGALNAFALGFLQFTGRWTNFVSAIPTIVLFFALARDACGPHPGRPHARQAARARPQALGSDAWKHSLRRGCRAGRQSAHADEPEPPHGRGDLRALARVTRAAHRVGRAGRARTTGVRRYRRIRHGRVGADRELRGTRVRCAAGDSVWRADGVAGPAIARSLFRACVDRLRARDGVAVLHSTRGVR